MVAQPVVNRFHHSHVTYLFRDCEMWKILENLLREKAAQRPIKAWSAGCSYGAEAYSLAILLYGLSGHDHIIIGTDCEDHVIESAIQGCFNDYDLDHISPRYVNRTPSFYINKPYGIQINDLYRSRVSFKLNDLVDDIPPGDDFDIICLRSVLAYINPAYWRAIAIKVYDSLASSGILFIGEDENELVDWRTFGFYNYTPCIYVKPSSDA